MIRFSRLAVVVCGALALGVGSAGATLDSEEYQCQNAVAKKGRVYFKKTFGAIYKCLDLIAKDELPASTDCRLETETAAKITQAADKFREKVELKCPNSVLADTGDELDFGGNCRGETSATALATCLIEEHDRAVDTILTPLYGRTQTRNCGKNGTDAICTSAAECSAGALPCTVPRDRRECQRDAAKAMMKFGNKRQSYIRKCKKDVVKGQLPAGTDCLTQAQTDLDAIEADTLADIQEACPDVVADALVLGDGCQAANGSQAMAACAVCVGTQQTNELITVQHGSGPTPNTTAAAVQITNPSDPTYGCVGGPLSRCRTGDYLLRNNRIRVVIQDAAPDTPVAGTTGRTLGGAVGPFGGNIIDADVVRTSPDPDRDNFEEWALSLNVEATAHYTSVVVLNDGSDGGPAVIRATGVDDLLDTINPSSAVAGFGLSFPASANDVDLPIAVVTDYILEPDTNWVRVETTVQNLDTNAHAMFFGEYLNGSGQVELFQGAYGFGEPLITQAGSATGANLTDFVAYSGEDEADGVSYGYVQTLLGTTTFTTSGVTVPQLGVNIVLVLIGAAPPNFTIEPVGDPDDHLSFTRYFVVGDGQASSITDARNQIRCLPTGTLQGTVTAGGVPQAGIDVSVLGLVSEGPSGLTRNVVTHTRTDASGNYSLTLPPGNYDVAAHLDGYPFEGGGSTPTLHAVAITFGGTTTQNMALPAAGAIQVLVVDENDDPIAAKASVVGFDPSLDPGNASNTTGMFGERFEDGLPFGVAKSIFIDPSGDSGVQPLEPGSYQVVVSHGPEYSTDEIPITVTAGSTSVVNAKVERVIDTTGFISGDFHVHAIDSADSEVTREERVISMLAEGVDFFTPSDHEFRVDFTPTLTALGVGSLISVAVSNEITTFDYGHFNAWPMTYDGSKVSGGAIDHGGTAPDGMDFPSAGNYSLPPADIIAAANADPGVDTVQINHIHSHFGLDGGSGLAIDTGVDPPQSGVPAAARRLDPSISNYFSEDFDALEVWIGDDRSQVYNQFLGQNAGDWFNLINQGIVRTGVFDSDTHRRTLTQSGFPRTMIASEEDDPGALGAIAETLSGTLNDGRAIGTNGPMVRVTTYASSTGESGGLDKGRCIDAVTPTACTDTSTCKPCTDDSQCTAPATCEELPTEISTTDGAVSITVDVQSPEWAPFDEVEFYVNTTTTRVTRGPTQTGGGSITYKRYTLNPDYSQSPTVTLVPVAGTSSSRWEAQAQLNLTGLSGDIWVVAMVKGNDGVSRPLFPVVPNNLKTSTNSTLANLTDGNLGEDGMTALAVTNPVFVDVDGGGWTEPGLQITP